MQENKLRKKNRLDVILLNKGFAQSREKAKAIIMSGVVFVNGEKEDKPGASFYEDEDIKIKGNTLRYVSRGGLKLEKAVDTFRIELASKICMDIGASTGGFTDCMLQNKASKVYAVDVGYGQLAWKLRNDSRVICMEKTNIRYINKELVTEPVDFVSADVSFISLSKIFPAVKELLSQEAKMVALIKPQFEAGREKVGKKGVVRDKNTHIEVITNVINYAFENGFKPVTDLSGLGLTYSPVKGPQGNIEYLIYLKRACIKTNKYKDIDFKNIIADIVDEAHDSLIN